MPFHVVVTDIPNAFFFRRQEDGSFTPVTEAQIIKALTLDGVSDPALLNTTTVSLAKNAPIAELDNHQGLLLGWTDDDSRAQLAAALNQLWGDDIDRIRLPVPAVNVGDDRLYGMAFDIEEPEFHVVICAERDAPPGYPWVRTVPSESDDGSLLITNILSPPA